MKNHFFPILLFFVSFGFETILGQASCLTNEKALSEKLSEHPDYAEAIGLLNAGKVLKARALFQEASTDFEKEKNWELFVLSTAKQSSTYNREENFQKGIELLNEALHKIEKQVPHHLQFQTFIYYQIGAKYCSIYQYDLALDAYNNQLKLLHKQYGESSNWEFVMVYNEIAQVYQKLGNNELSLDYFLRAISIVEDQNLANLSLTMRTLSGLVGTYSFHLGKHAEAIKTAKNFLDLAIERYGKNALELVDFYLIMAKTLSLMDERKQSLGYYKKALFLLESEGMHDRKLQIFNNLGFNYKAIGNYDQALFYWQKYLDEQKKNPKISTEKIVIATSMAGIFLAKKEYDKAIEYFNQADSFLQVIKHEIVNEESLFHAKRSFHWNYAQFWKATHQPQKEKKHLLELVNNYSKKGSEWYNSGNYRQLAGIYAQEGNIDSAFYANQQAIIGLCNRFNSSDIKDIPSVNDLNNYLWVYPTLNQKVWLYSLKAKDAKEQEDKLQLFKAGIEIVDLADEYHLINMKQASLLRGSNSNKLIEFSSWNYKSGLSLAYDYYEQCAEETSIEKGFYFVQKMKSQNLWQSLLKSDALSFGALDETILQTEKTLQNEINLYEKKLLEARANKDTLLINKYQNKHLFDLKKDFADLQEMLESKYPQYFTSKYNFTAETGKSLQKILEEDELLIEYVVHDNSLYIFTVSKDQKLQFHKIPCDEQKITERIFSLKQLLENSSMMRKRSREKFINLSHELYAQFLQPIEKQLAEKRRLVIIGDGMTNYIPFEILLKTNEVKSFKELDYLIKNHEISYHYSSTLFAKAKGKETVKHSGIYAFAPVYDEGNDEILAFEGSENEGSNSTLRAFKTDGSFSPLPQSEKEVRSIIALFNKNNKPGTNILDLREFASEASLKSNLEKPYQIVHIAGHSFANLENPKFSGIACYEDKKNTKEDGTLYTGEIYNIRSKADLVTLSSCESGMGKLQTSEGVLGLNRAFIYAGTPNVVYSLWKVYDKVSAKLMVEFYKNILSSASYASSLRSAKLKLLDSEATASPHFWSPYLLIGR